MFEQLKYLGPLSALLLAACVSTSPQKSSFDSNNDAVQVWYNNARTSVEKQLGVDLKHVSFSIVDNDIMNKYFADSAKQFATQHFRRKFHSDIIKDSIAKSIDSTIAVYDDRTKFILVSQQNFERYVKHLMHKGFTSEQAALPILYHELVHAGDDVLLDFQKLRRKANGSQLALSAVIEGHAQFVSRKLCEQSICSNAFESASAIFMSTDAKSHKLSIFESSPDNTELKYIEGERFLSSLFTRGGDDLLEHALKHPPQKVIQIYNPDRFPDKQRENSSLILKDALLTLSADWINDGWARFPDYPVDGMSFSQRRSIRVDQINKWASEIAGSAKVEYYNQALDELEPVRITLYQLVNNQVAKEFSKREFQRAYMNSGSLIGYNLKLKNLKSSHQKIPQNLQRSSYGYRQDLQADIIDPEDKSVFPFAATVLQTGNLVARILSYRPNKEHDQVVVTTNELMNGLL